jgi:class 3 adenylate cyclase
MVAKLHDIKRMKQFDLFDDVSNEDLVTLVKHVSVDTPAVGDYIIHEGKFTRRIFLLERGLVDVFKQIGNRLVRINTLGPGDYFGEIGSVLNCPATATVRAREDVTVLSIEEENFLIFIRRHKNVFFRIFKTTTERLSSTNILQLRHLIDELDFYYQKFLDVQKIWYFLPAELVARTLRGELDDIQKGIVNDVTILFLDLRHYTFFAEIHEPEVVLRTLNDMFTEVTRIVTRNDGNVDKFIGDGLMAVFSSETTPTKNANNALNAAVEIMRFLRGYNTNRYRNHQEEFYLGLGLNSGKVVFGNVGVENMMMNYTAIGDVVNVASRICSHEKNNTIAIAEATYKLVYRKLQNYEVSKQEQVELRGRREPVTFYHLSGFYG